MKKRLKYKHPHFLLIRLIIFCSLIIVGNTITFALADATAVQVSGGSMHTLVRNESGSVWASGGTNIYGENGIGTNYQVYTLAQVLKGDQSSSTNYLEDIKDINAGSRHSLACDNSGYVWAWGDDSEGQLGTGSGDGSSYTPVQVHGGEMETTFLEDIKNVSVGSSGQHSLARDSSGYVWSWGKNDYGQLGIGLSSSTPQQAPVQVHKGEQYESENDDDPLINIQAISASSYHSMALDNVNRYVYSWGKNDKGQLGIDSITNKDTPEIVLKGEQSSSSIYLEGITAISTCGSHSMALDENGYVYCWGDTFHGILGIDPINSNSRVPVLVHRGNQYESENDDDPLINIQAISAGDVHCMALDENGYVYCWGDNSTGQLGIGFSTEYSKTPAKVKGPGGTGYLSNIKYISAGSLYSIAIDNDGTIYTWGHGIGGCLCTGEVVYTTDFPDRVPVVRNITQGSSYYRNQRAIKDASDYDVIEAGLGTYAEVIDFLGKPLELRSTNIDDLNVIENTIIFPYTENPRPSVTFDSSEDFDSKLCGFTLLHINALGAIYCSNSAPSISKCIIKTTKNYPLSSSLILYYSSPIIKNCVIYDDRYDWYGYDCYGIHNYESNPIITNCTIKDHRDFAIYNENSNPVITNCILWDNNGGTGNPQIYNDNSSPTISYCCIQNGYASGSNIITSDPDFVDYFHIDNDSPCINAGTNYPLGGYLNKDLDGDLRVCGSMDIGADETSIGESIPEYTYAFICEDSSSYDVAIFDEGGNLFLEGGLTINTTPEVSANDEFVILDSHSNKIAIIDTSNGDMEIAGMVYDLQNNQTTMNTNGTNFLIKDSSGNVKAYIDYSGNMYLMGRVYEN